MSFGVGGMRKGMREGMREGVHEGMKHLTGLARPILQLPASFFHLLAICFLLAFQGANLGFPDEKGSFTWDLSGEFHLLAICFLIVLACRRSLPIHRI